MHVLIFDSGSMAEIPTCGRTSHLGLPGLDAFGDEEPHDLGAAPPGCVVQCVVAPLGAGVEVGPALQEQLQNVDTAVVRCGKEKDLFPSGHLTVQWSILPIQFRNREFMIHE